MNNINSGFNGKEPFVLWLTGLSGAGKSTTAMAIHQSLTHLGRQAHVLDGDVLRQGLCRDLGFSAQDRSENIRRVSEVAKLFVDAGVIIIVATISPLRQMRRDARARFPANKFIEIFIDAPMAVCEERDPKGLYRKARAGNIAHFTGVDSLYEAPEAPEIHLHTDQQSVDDSVAAIFDYLYRQGYLHASVEKQGR